MPGGQKDARCVVSAGGFICHSVFQQSCLSCSLCGSGCSCACGLRETTAQSRPEGRTLWFLSFRINAVVPELQERLGSAEEKQVKFCNLPRSD